MWARILALALPLAGSLDTSYNLSEPRSFDKCLLGAPICTVLAAGKPNKLPFPHL